MKMRAVIAIFDIGKTNKKLFLFDESYSIVLERSVRLAETIDEDGETCEDIQLLTTWIVDTLGEVLRMEEFDIKALNFSTYGASFVHLDVSGKPLTPLYNYLKKFPEDLSNQFYEKYDGKISFSLETASPVLGNLNSGLQLYFLKQAKSGLFEKINHSLHLPQYLSYLVTGKFCSELTSIGCHTALWNFAHKEYHDWVFKEGIHHKLSRIVPSDSVVPVIYQHKSFYCGIGLHDSSAALIPYLTNFTEPFVLISTGTWCISLNPFNDRPLTKDELRQDCLCYISYKGEPVKASRLFAGYEHEQQTKRLAAHFMVAEDYHRQLPGNLFKRNHLWNRFR
jgi:sugar (pentulose or hexulose) kinase